MENLQKIVEQIDNVKEKLTDGEYKTLMEDLGLLNNKKEIYVKVLSISCQTTVYTETTRDDEDNYESYIHNITDNFRYEVCNNEACDCGQCNREPLKTVEVKSIIKEETKWLKVIDDEERKLLVRSHEIGRWIYDMLKRSKTYHMDGDILVYLEDNE